MWKNRMQATEAIRAMLHKVGLDQLWTPDGPTAEAGTLVANDGQLSPGDQTMVRVAFDLWNGTGGATVADLLRVLDGNELRAAFNAIAVARPDLRLARPPSEAAQRRVAEERKRRESIAAWAQRWRVTAAEEQPSRSAWYDGYHGCVGPGWMAILDRLAADLLELGWDRRLAQVKEKFGELRFYVCSGTEAMRQRISQAEEESLRTCETCGAPASRRTIGKKHIRTRCELCEARERRRER